MEKCTSCMDILDRLDNKAHMYQVLSKLGFGTSLIPTQILSGRNIAGDLKEKTETICCSQRYYLKSDVGCCSRQSRGGTLPELVLWIEECHRENDVESQYVLQPDMSSECEQIRGGKISEQRVLVQVNYPNRLKVCNITFKKTSSSCKEIAAPISPECSQFVVNMMTKYLKEFPVECKCTINIGFDIVQRRKGSKKLMLLEINIADKFSPCACKGHVTGFTKNLDFPKQRLMAVTRSCARLKRD